ncbi:MAG: tandem-95 repeat protein, partial [Armatimonadetes bacterium]|nr:tandem-95 repeat protein [Armatimonadota bacterium]
PLTFSIVSDGSNGHVSITDDETGDFTYTPNALYSGADSFEFQVFDGLNYSNIGTVTVNILANDPPVAAADSAVVMENSSVNIPILANDYDPDGVTITLLSITQPAHGQNVLEADDTVTYTPNTGYSGADTFTYTILDNRGASAT